MRSLTAIKLSLLFLTVFLSGCLEGQSAVPDADMTGTWDVSYSVSQTMNYRAFLFVKIEEDLLADQTGGLLLGEDPNSRVTEGHINDGSVTFRWAYHKPGNTLWDHVFIGKYGIDEDGNEILEGTLTGDELNSDCVYPVPPNPKEIQKTAFNDCPRHQVTGTWRAKRYSEL